MSCDYKGKQLRAYFATKGWKRKVRKSKRENLRDIDRYDLKLDAKQTTIYKDYGSPRQRKRKTLERIWKKD